MNVVGLLRKKALRRIALLAVLVAPIIYLFGTQIGALAGAHGEEVLAETPYQEEWIETNDFQTGKDFKFVWDEVFTIDFPSTRLTTTFNFKSGDSEFYSILWGQTGSYQTQYIAYNQINVGGTDLAVIVHRSPDLGWTYYPVDATIYFSSSSLPTINILTYGTLYYKNRVQNTNYRDSLFNNMFGQSNFLTEWGQRAIDNRAGLPPVNQLLKFIAEDGLNIANSNIGLMGIGYATYVLHAVMIYEFVALAIELLTIPLKIGDWLTKGVNKE